MGGIKLRKWSRRLKARQMAWEAHGKNPQSPNNPSNITGAGHDMHKPGSGKR